MTLEIFTIKDELAGTFGNLMVINPKVKNRTFRWLTEETEKSDCDDKRIYKLGMYDTETGLIQSQAPELVYNIEQEKKQMEEPKKPTRGKEA
nr:DNA binding protein [Microvirus sp.]